MGEGRLGRFQAEPESIGNERSDGRLVLEGDGSEDSGNGVIE